jgi:hypothetical protein
MPERHIRFEALEIDRLARFDSTINLRHAGRLAAFYGFSER